MAGRLPRTHSRKTLSPWQPPARVCGNSRDGLDALQGKLPLVATYAFGGWGPVRLARADHPSPDGGGFMGPWE